MKKVGYYHCFPFKDIEKESHIIIYGMGEVGRHYLQQLKKTRYAYVDYVTDARWNEIKDIDVKVVPPDFLRNIDTNIVIASGRKEVAIEIVSSLMNMGISTKRIIWNDLIVKEEMFFEKMFQDSFSEMLSNAVLKNKVILQRINNRTEYEKFVSNNREIFIYEDVLSSFYKKILKQHIMDIVRCAKKKYLFCQIHIICF